MYRNSSMLTYLTSYTLPEISARVVLKNWEVLHNDERYHKCVRECIVPVKEYTDKYRDYNSLDARSSILCILDNLDDFDNPVLIETEKKLIEAYREGNRMEVIRILVTLNGKKFDEQKYSKRLEKHDHKEFDRVCKERKIVCDYHKYQDWVEQAQRERREDDEEDLFDSTIVHR